MPILSSEEARKVLNEMFDEILSRPPETPPEPAAGSANQTKAEPEKDSFAKIMADYPYMLGDS